MNDVFAQRDRTRRSLRKTLCGLYMRLIDEDSESHPSIMKEIVATREKLLLIDPAEVVESFERLGNKKETRLLA